jgi:RNA polymerase sigma-70 factor (ECF subfamily)
LAAADDLPLQGHYLYHAVRADLLRRVGRRSEAVAAYEAARALTDNEAERSFLLKAQASAIDAPRE